MLPTSEQLARWRADVCAFAEEALWVRSPESGQVGPLRLADHQRAWLTEATRREDGAFVHKVCIASWPKREGKTLCVSVVVAWRLATRTGERCGIIANSEAQARSNIFDAVATMFRTSPALATYTTDDDVQARRLTIPAGDNVLTCYPANHRTVQGTAFSCLACDELHASEDGGRAWTFASQQTEAADAQALVASQAGMPTNLNPMWRLHQAAESGKGRVYFSYRQDLATPWARARAEAAEAELLPLEFAYLWRNEWGGTGAALFPADVIAEATRLRHGPQSAAEWEHVQRVVIPELLGCDLAGTTRIGVGLDRAGVGPHGDRSVWTVVARFLPHGREPVFGVVRQVVFPTGSEAEIIGEHAQTLAIFGRIHGCLFEQYGCSDVVEKVRVAELVAPTSQRQAGAFNRLHRLLTEGRLWLSADHELLRSELLTFGYSCERGGIAKFGTQSGHDDTVYSLVWAVESVADAPQRSQVAMMLGQFEPADQEDNDDQPSDGWKPVRGHGVIGRYIGGRA